MYQSIKDLQPGKFRKICTIDPAGSLEARLLSTGAIQFYWRTQHSGKQVRVPIGLFDDRAPPKSLKPTTKGYSIPAAIRKAEEIAHAHLENKDAGGYPALLGEKKERERNQYQAKVEAKEWTVKKLCLAYSDYLEKLGRISHREARNALTRHVIDAWPDLAALPATSLTPDDVVNIIRKVHEAGKGRTANKVRSYIRAAFQVAKDARLDASIPVAFKNYKINFNPASDTKPDKKSNQADKRPLHKADLIAYWQTIKDVPGLRGAVIRLHLLTGGQRIQQLVALLTADITKEHITLYDGKGRPGGEVRQHIVPLIPAARKALDEAGPMGLYALSTENGRTHISNATLSGWAQAAVADVLPTFQPKQIRSGVETLLASLGVSKEIRGRLQSHGITGVQAKHYDAYDYLPEKRSALLKLYNVLEQKGADVIHFNAA